MILVQHDPRVIGPLADVQTAVLGRLEAGHAVHRFVSGKELQPFLQDLVCRTTAAQPDVVGLTRVLLLTPDPHGFAAIIVRRLMAPGGHLKILRSPECWTTLATMGNLNDLLALQPDWLRVTGKGI